MYTATGISITSNIVLNCAQVEDLKLSDVIILNVGQADNLIGSFE